MPFKDKTQRKKYNEIYYTQKRLDILAQKKSVRNDDFRSKKRAYDKKYRGTAKGRFVRTRMSKVMMFEEYIELKKKQNDLCAICRKKCSSGRNLAIDHCHKRNIVRGLLCGNCNLGLGKFFDDVELLKRAIIYLNEKEK